MFGSYPRRRGAIGESGIANLAVQELFAPGLSKSVITVNFLEIYNE